MNETKIILFKNKKVRKVLHNNEWYFSVVDIIEALTDSSDPHDYWYRMKIRVKGEENIELSTICRRLKLLSSDGKKYETDCVNTEDSKGIAKLKSDAQAGGTIAGGARSKLEQRLGRSVVTGKNFLPIRQTGLQNKKGKVDKRIERRKSR